jgi:hypothetical protein
VQEIIETFLLRNLQEVFGEGDPTRRRAAIAELYKEDCVVLLPIGRYVGRDALDRVAGELRAGHPNFVYTPHRAPGLRAGHCFGSHREIAGPVDESCRPRPVPDDATQRLPDLIHIRTIQKGPSGASGDVYKALKAAGLN